MLRKLSKWSIRHSSKSTLSLSDDADTASFHPILEDEDDKSWGLGAGQSPSTSSLVDSGQNLSGGEFGESNLRETLSMNSDTSWPTSPNKGLPPVPLDADEVPGDFDDRMPGSLPLDKWTESSTSRWPQSQLNKPLNKPQEPEGQLGSKRGKASSSFLNGLAGYSIVSQPSETASSSTPTHPTSPDDDTFASTIRRHPPSDPYPTPETPSSAFPSDQPPLYDDEEDLRRKRRKRRQQNSSFNLLALQSLSVSNAPSTYSPTAPSSIGSFQHSESDTGVEQSIGSRLEEAAKQARLKAAREFNHSTTTSAGPSTPLPPFKHLPDDEALQHLPGADALMDEHRAESSRNVLPPMDETSGTTDNAITLTDESTILNDNLQEIINRRLRQLSQTVEENQRLQTTQGEQESPLLHLHQEQTMPEPSFIPPIDLTSPLLPQSSLPTPPNETEAMSTSPLSSPLADTKARELQEEVLLLRTLLQESKARIQALAVEKLAMLQGHKAEMKDIEEHLKSQVVDNQRLEDENRSQAEKIRQLDSQLLHSQSRVDALSRDNQRLRDRHDQQGEDIKDLSERLKHQVLENERMERDRAALSKLKDDVKHAQTHYKVIMKEKAGWQSQIDAMQHLLSESERRVRCLDQMTRHRFESKQEGGFGSRIVGRSSNLHHSPHVKGPSTDLIGAVGMFNVEVLQTANQLVENLERPQRGGRHGSLHVDSKGKHRAKTVLGEKVTGMLEQQSRNTVNPTMFNFLLMQNCLEVFITHWCTNIIEALYPHQPSFADLLVELAAQTGSSTLASNQQICGRQTQIIQTKSLAPSFSDWVKDMMHDLTSILAVGGVKIRQNSQRPDLFDSKLLPLVKIAYDLRLALAERDICGGLEIAAPAPDMPFNSKFMDEEHALDRKTKKNGLSTDWSEPDFIAGTSAVGLKRTLNGQPGVYEMVIKPKVVLIRVLESDL